MKKLLKTACALSALLIMMFCMTSIANAETLKNLKEVQVGETKPVKCGDYYFAYDGRDGGTLMGTSKTKINKTTPLPSDFLCDGQRAFYINERNQKLYSYNLSTRKKTSLKDLSTFYGKGFYPQLKAGYKKLLYITIENYNTYTFQTYCFNRSTKEWKRVSKSDEVKCMKDGYVVTNSRFHQDVSPEYYTLREINAEGGWTKVKVLTKAGMSVTFIGSKLYYVNYPNKYEDGAVKVNKAVLKKCNKDGSNVETIKAFSSKEGEVYVFSITSKSCSVYKNDVMYEYTYKTDKLTKQ